MTKQENKAPTPIQTAESTAVRSVVQKEEPSGAKGLLRDILIMIPIVIIAVVLLKAFVFGTYEIPSGSMIDTIEINDRVISEKITYLTREPERGEIITFKDPTQPDRTLIKRVIATGGETVSLTPDGHVTINGEILELNDLSGSITMDSELREAFQNLEIDLISLYSTGRRGVGDGGQPHKLAGFEVFR